MDDTLQCSAARWPAGIDGRYPRHTPYPGVTAFYRELQGGGELGQLVALSARPHLVGEMIEKKIFERFSKLKEEHGLHAMPALLTGSVDAGAMFLVTGGTEDGMRALAKKKFENLEEYIALYPEFRIVFIGDNGQADYAVGQMMCRRYPHNVEQVWIHEVYQALGWFRNVCRDAARRVNRGREHRLGSDREENPCRGKPAHHPLLVRHLCERLLGYDGVSCPGFEAGRQ